MRPTGKAALLSPRRLPCPWGWGTATEEVLSEPRLCVHAACKAPATWDGGMSQNKREKGETREKGKGKREKGKRKRKRG